MYINSTKHNIVLHLACLHNDLELVLNYLNYLERLFEKKILNRRDINIWVNVQNDEGFTALHIASFKGNLPMV